jgi:hypothetical protein
MDPGPTEPPTGTLRVQPIPNRDSRTDSDRTLSAPEEPRPALGLFVHFGSQPPSPESLRQASYAPGPASLIRPPPRPPQCVGRRTLLGRSSRDPGRTSPAASAQWERGGDRRGAAWVHLRSRPTALGPPPPGSAGAWDPIRTRPVGSRQARLSPMSRSAKAQPALGGGMLSSYVWGPAQGTLQAPPLPWNSIHGAGMGRPRPTHTPRVPIGARSPRPRASQGADAYISGPAQPSRPTGGARLSLYRHPHPDPAADVQRPLPPSMGPPTYGIHRETTPAPGTAGDPGARPCALWDPGRITYDAPPIAPSGTLDVRIPNVGRPHPPRRGRDPRRMNPRPPPLDLRRLSP